MYMREMGSVELLTREGEIEIAKRIEDGLKHMVMAISACPTTINEILAHITRVREGQAQIDEVVDGLVDPEDGEEYAGAGVTADEDENDDGPAGGMSSKQLEDQIGRASCRGRGCQYVQISEGAVELKKK